MLNKQALLLAAALGALTVSPAYADSADTAASTQPINDVITVTGRYLSIDQLNSVKTPTPIIDVPQSLSIVTRAQIEDQTFSSIGDILRYTPGLAVSQGEGHRDAIIIRGHQTTADFFVDGLRDDVQYYRPLYNLEQVEVLRGSNALLFGRGGGGGIINRVTKTPDLNDTFSVVNASLDTFGQAYLAGDANFAIDDKAGIRLNAFVEHLDNHRDAFDGDRYGLNPTFRYALSPQTEAVFSAEYVNDDRVVDRGVPSVPVTNGPDVPLEGFRDTFFGDPDANFTQLEAVLLRSRVDHTFNDNLRGYVTVQYADYDKAYQNIYAAGFTPADNRLTLDGYRDVTTRQNFIAQANLIGDFQTGPFEHTILVGLEYGDQSTANGRLDNRFADSNDDQITIDFTDPVQVPAFSFGPALTDRESEVKFTSLYVQDQISLTPQLKLVLGARFDRFDIEVLDLLAAAAPNSDTGRRSRVDEEVSPRLGLIYKPVENMSFYASYSETFLPSAGDQFLTLSTTTDDIQPQRFENTEVGFKWDIGSNLSLTSAIFRNERGLFTTVNPNNMAEIITLPGSVTDGFEIQLAGKLTDRWTVNTGYSYLDSTVDGGAFDGNRTTQTPEHMFSIWNEYQATDALALALGLTYQDAYFVREDNAVLVPDFTRVDAAVFYDVSDDTRLQLNIENLLDEEYFPDAHSNDNISTGKPLNARVSIRHRF